MRFSVPAAVCALAATSMALPSELPKESIAERQSSGPSFMMVPHDQAQAKVQQGNADAKSNPQPFVQMATTTPCSNVRVRTEWRLLSDAQKSSFVNAIKCLMNRPSAGGYPGSKSRYEDIVSVHQRMVNSIHMVGQFLPWHRYMLHIFEDMLRAECSFPGPMPWWDETKDAGHFSSSPMFDSRYFGSGPLKTSSGGSTCMTQTGVFRGTTCNLGPGSATNRPHCLARALDESLTAQCSANYVATCRSASRYSDFETCTEYGPHAYGHNGIGAVMSDVATSPSDPVFYMHHSFVDHSWRIWQNDQYPARLSAIGGPTTQGGSQQLTLDYTLSSLGLRPSVQVRDVMDTTGQYLCYKYNV